MFSIKRCTPRPEKRPDAYLESVDETGMGGILTGEEIIYQVEHGNISISSFSKDQVNPNSYNVHSGDRVTVYDAPMVFDLKDPKSYEKTVTFGIDSLNGFVLRPGQLYLIPTQEVIGSKKYIPMITGRSSIGRLGITVHQEAGFGDIGFNGVWTMQVRVTYPTKIYPNQLIAQVYFLVPCGDTGIKYSGRYQNTMTATASRWRD